MNILIANARQLTSIEQEIYEWKRLDAIYKKITDNLLATITPMWQANFTPQAQGWITEATIQAAVNLTANRFFPSANFTPNPVNWNSLKPFCPPILLGYNLPDSTPITNQPFNAQIRAVGEVLYSWINTRVHRSEGTLQRVALLQKGKQIGVDSSEINALLATAFS